MQSALNYRFQTAVQAAQKAGQLLRKNFSQFEKPQIKLKSKHEIITPFDQKAEKIILSLIQKNFPKDHILSEEAGNIGQKSNWLWVIDPLDGTANFAMANPIFAVSIAVFNQNRPVIAVIHAPMLNKVFTAQKNKPSLLNKQIIQCSDQKYISKSTIAFCHGRSTSAINQSIAYYKIFKRRARHYRQLGAASIELALVASGLLDAYIMPGAPAWDIAAGVLIAKNAGCKTTDLMGKPWTIGSPSLLAANPKLHPQILRLLRRSHDKINSK